MQTRTPRTICLDFDRVIHKYSKGWKDGSIYDKPVPGAREAIKRLIKAGFVVIILTVKSSRGETRNREIRTWLKHYGFPQVEVTNIKPAAIAYIDDRAIRFTNWVDIIHYFL